MPEQNIFLKSPQQLCLQNLTHTCWKIRLFDRLIDWLIDWLIFGCAHPHSTEHIALHFNQKNIYRELVPPTPFTKSFGQTFEIWLSTFCIYNFCWGSTHVIVKAQQHPTYHTICFLLAFFSPEDLYKRNTLQKSRLYTEWFLVISKNTIHLTYPSTTNCFHTNCLPPQS